MLINTTHILKISKPQKTYISKENGIEIEHPNIIITFINKEYQVVFFKEMFLAENEYELLSSKNFNEYSFLDIDMEFTKSIFYAD